VKLISSVLASLAIILGLAVNTAPASAQVYIRVGPPAPVVERYGRPPHRGYVWVAGHQQWNGRRYVWVAGSWTAPRPGRAWVAGHYRHDPRGYVWVAGYWH
jgi:hypothetical protein